VSRELREGRKSASQLDAVQCTEMWSFLVPLQLPMGAQEGGRGGRTAPQGLKADVRR
jgi:hypothetical protein